MPSTVPSYMYTFFALAIVGTLLICTFSSFAVSMRRAPENEQLKNILEKVASESCELLSLVVANNSTVNTVLDLPSTIGDKRYWIRLGNDTSSAWVEGGLGDVPSQTENRVYLPGMPKASGQFISGNGVAKLECYKNGSKICLYLTGG